MILTTTAECSVVVATHVCVLWRADVGQCRLHVRKTANLCNPYHTSQPSTMPQAVRHGHSACSVCAGVAASACSALSTIALAIPGTCGWLAMLLSRDGSRPPCSARSLRCESHPRCKEIHGAPRPPALGLGGSVARVYSEDPGGKAPGIDCRLKTFTLCKSLWEENYDDSKFLGFAASGAKARY